MNDTVLSILWGALRIGILIAIILLIRTFLIEPYSVTGTSMEPTLKDGSVIIGAKYDKTYVHSRIVVYKRSGRNEISVGRVVGLPGDTIKIEGGNVYLNGELADEPFLESGITTDSGEIWFLEEGVDVVVPENNFFIMGDNREGSVDSREWGFVPRENIQAKFIRCAFRC